MKQNNQKPEKPATRAWKYRDLNTFTQYPVAVKVVQDNRMYAADIHIHNVPSVQRVALAAGNAADAKTEGLNLLTTLGRIYQAGAASAAKVETPVATVEDLMKKVFGSS